MEIFRFMNMHLKIPSAKCRPFYPGVDELTCFDGIYYDANINTAITGAVTTACTTDISFFTYHPQNIYISWHDALNNTWWKHLIIRSIMTRFSIFLDENRSRIQIWLSTSPNGVRRYFRLSGKTFFITIILIFLRERSFQLIFSVWMTNEYKLIIMKHSGWLARICISCFGPIGVRRDLEIDAFMYNVFINVILISNYHCVELFLCLRSQLCIHVFHLQSKTQWHSTCQHLCKSLTLYLWLARTISFKFFSLTSQHKRHNTIDSPTRLP